jgi:hypothetical protein
MPVNNRPQKHLKFLGSSNIGISFEIKLLIPETRKIIILKNVCIIKNYPTMFDLLCGIFLKNYKDSHLVVCDN